MKISARYTLVIVQILIIAIVLFLLNGSGGKNVLVNIAYATRPIWGVNPEKPFNNIIRNHYSPDLSNQERCRLMGLKSSLLPGTLRILDAILFSVELDLLEVCCIHQ